MTLLHLCKCYQMATNEWRWTMDTNLCLLGQRKQMYDKTKPFGMERNPMPGMSKKQKITVTKITTLSKNKTILDWTITTQLNLWINKKKCFLLYFTIRSFSSLEAWCKHCNIYNIVLWNRKTQILWVFFVFSNFNL